MVYWVSASTPYLITQEGSYNSTASSSSGTAKSTIQQVFDGFYAWYPFSWTGNFVTDTACFGGGCVTDFNFF